MPKGEKAGGGKEDKLLLKQEGAANLQFYRVNPQKT